jgi:hypothetical protein
VAFVTFMEYWVAGRRKSSIWRWTFRPVAGQSRATAARRRTLAGAEADAIRAAADGDAYAARALADADAAAITARAQALAGHSQQLIAAQGLALSDTLRAALAAEGDAGDAHPPLVTNGQRA